MKKWILFLLGLVILWWCADFSTIKEIKTQQETKIPIALVTEANSWEVINQTGDQLLYRNEIYGFEVLLWKAWKNAQIFVKDGIAFFALPYTYEWSRDNLPGEMDFDMAHMVAIYIFTPEQYLEMGNGERSMEYEGIEEKHAFLELTLGINNKYYFWWDRYSPDDEDVIKKRNYYQEARKNFFETFSTFDIAK